MYHIFKIAFVIMFFEISITFSESKDTLKTYITPSITVTSNKAVIGSTPVPYAELTKTDIQRIYTAQDIPVLLSDLPSTIFYSQNGNGIGYNSITMRGFDGYRIGVMINGIPQNDPEDHNVYWIDFPDLTSNIDNIQVQRGAGVTNYGAASIGGNINLTTSNFVNKQGIKIYNGIGFQEYALPNDNKFQATTGKQSFEVSSGLVGNYAFYGRLSRIGSAGYRDNSWTDLNSFFLSGVRFDDNFSTQINIFGGPLTDGLAYNGLPKSYITDPNLRRKNYSYFSYDSTGQNINYFSTRRPQETEFFSQPHFEILNDWHVNDNFNIKSSLFYYQGEGYYDFDGSWADTTTLRINEQNGFKPIQNPGNTLLRGYVGNKQGGWICSGSWLTGQHEIMGGFEIRIHRSEHWGKVQYADNLPTGFDPDFKIYSYKGERNILSAFIRDKFNIDDKLSIFAEAQLTNQSYAINNEKSGYKYTKYLSLNGDTIGNGNNLFDINYLFFNPKIGFNYNLSKSINFYGMTAFTHREPRMVNLYPAESSYDGGYPLFQGSTVNNVTRYDFTKPLVQPEKMFDFELGSNLTENLNSLNFNFYWMSYTDELVKSGRLDIFGNPIDGNAPKTLHYGIELAGTYHFDLSSKSKLQINANTTISHNEILEYNFATSATQTISLKGNQVSGFPSTMANLRLTYIQNEFMVSFLVKYVGSYKTDNFGDMLKSNKDLISYLQGSYDGYYNDNEIRSYVLCNFDISYNFKNVLSLQNIRVHAQINNLFNTLYTGGGAGKEFFPGAERYVFVGLELGI